MKENIDGKKMVEKALLWFLSLILLAGCAKAPNA